jgi:hypothetical protein
MAVLAACSSSPRPAAEPAPAAQEPLMPPPGPPPAEPVGEDCITHARVEPTLTSIRPSVAPTVALADFRLVEATCKKRVYMAGTARFVVWEVDGLVRGTGTSHARPLPTAACIERGLAEARRLVPFAHTIIDREVARDPAWRDPDLGFVTYLECDQRGEPSLDSISTMLHETLHRISVYCILEFDSDQEVCVHVDGKPLLEGRIALYAKPPAQLAGDDLQNFEHVQTTYLVHNGQGIRDLLEEVTAYRIEAETYAIGRARKIYSPRRRMWLNLPVLMALATRYLDELAARDWRLALSAFGAGTDNRKAILAILDRAEQSYATWLKAVGGKAPKFEQTFWDDYQRHRRQWLARGRGD